MGDTGVDVGAGVTLSSLEDLLRQQVASQPPHKTRGLAAAAEQLRWFAGMVQGAQWAYNSTYSTPYSRCSGKSRGTHATTHLLSSGRLLTLGGGGGCYKWILSPLSGTLHTG